MNWLLAAALAAGGFSGGFMAGCWYFWRQGQGRARERGTWGDSH